MRVTSELGVKLDEAANYIREAKSILIAAGAGMGVDSGLPDFRGVNGFWRAYPPLAQRGLSFEEMANPFWFRSDPKLAFGFYGHRLNLYRNVRPHQGFTLLRALAREKQDNYFVFTSNVDGQFQKASFGEDKILECHGSIHHFQCESMCSNATWDASNVHIEVDENTLTASSSLPKCPHCGYLARPNVLMFNDPNWTSKRADAQRKRYEQWVHNIRQSKTPLVILEFGAGTSVPSVRYNSELVLSLLRGNAKLIRINKRESQVSDLDALSVAAGALETMQALADRLGLQIKE